MTAVTSRDEALDAAASVIARDLAEQQARPATEAARLALGRDATPDAISAWIAQHRPPATHRSTA